MFVFDTWFYITHHFLHIEWLMRHVHRHHHVSYEILSNLCNRLLSPKTPFILSKLFYRDRWDILCALWYTQWIHLWFQLLGSLRVFTHFLPTMAELLTSTAILIITTIEIATSPSTGASGITFLELDTPRRDILCLMFLRGNSTKRRRNDSFK